MAGEQRERYWLTRDLFLRCLGGIYLVAFFSFAQQAVPLIGTRGLLPARPYLDAVAAGTGSTFEAFAALPTVFWFNCSDAALVAVGYAGTGLAAVAILGFANAPAMALLWALYLSVVHAGQLFYGYGWEILLLETGFLAIFLSPPLRGGGLAAQSPPATVIIWLLRWVLFRVMFGAGLIKLRGDACWRDLTCMIYHYETQPLPNPASWYLHHLPVAVHKFEVLFNHFVELVVPWTLFAPRRLRHLGGVFLVLFQLLLIVSGNLSFLNWLTLALCIACFDDQALRALAPRRLRLLAATLADRGPSRPRQLVAVCLAVFVASLSIKPVQNLVGSRQVMNGSFDRLHLVNTYGAFGSVGRHRPEIILEGTDDTAITDTTVWKPYEFKCKPGDVRRRPCVIAPYQYRIDWQIWFAAMEDARSNPWLVHFIAQLLDNDPGALGLLANNPFPDNPPHLIHAELYEYAFTSSDDPSGAWWTRRYVGSYLPPLAADDPTLVTFLDRHGWSPASNRE